MKRILFLSAAIACASLAHAGDFKVTAITSTAPKGAPTTVFAPDIPIVYALFKTTGAHKGDTVRGVWIAEDVGDKAPPNTTIGEKTIVLESDTNDGNISLSKPDAGWPTGTYRFDLYAGDKLGTAVKFTISDNSKAAAPMEKSAEKQTAAASGSKSIKFPEKDPAFTFELPKGWTYTTDKDGNLDCKAGNDETYVFSILNLDDVHNDEELKTALPEVATTLAKAMHLKNFEAGDIETDTNGEGVSFTGIAGDGEANGTGFTVMVHAFEPQKGKYYALALAATKESDAKHEQDYDDITASITPIGK
jgi:hypothetical protein